MAGFSKSNQLDAGFLILSRSREDDNSGLYREKATTRVVAINQILSPIHIEQE